MISTQKIYQTLERQQGFISVVELAMMLEANTNEIRQRLSELGDRVLSNDRDEWRVRSDLVQRLKLSPLSDSEIKERDELENTVQQAFYVAGQALKVLRDKKLYRETHRTFESYVKERFDFSRIAAYYLISAAEVVNNLKCQPLVNILPTNERQCREVAKLPPEIQPQAWLTSIEKAGGKVPPARIIKQVVNEIKGKKEKMFSKPKKDGPVLVPGIGIEYIAVLDEETHSMLKKYQEKIGTATFNGAIRRLLDEERQRNESVHN